MFLKKKEKNTQNNNNFLKILFKSKNFYGGYYKFIKKENLPFLYGIRNNQIIINLKYLNFFIKRTFNLLKLTLKKKKKILIIANSDDINFLINKNYKKKNPLIFFFNKKWINGNITNKNINFFVKKHKINLIIIYKISNIYFNKELFSLKIPIISFLNPTDNLNYINYPLITNLKNIKSIYSLMFLYRKIF